VCSIGTGDFVGIDLYVLKLLSHHREKWGPLGKTLQIGRQGIHISETAWTFADTILKGHGIERSFFEAGGSEQFSDRLFQSLGATEVLACDASGYEGATLIHDFNEPLGEKWLRQFDTVFDGGSLEHIFNVPVALGNMMAAVTIGGRIISINGANNFLGHGLYQFSPELYFRVFSPENGFRILDLFIVPTGGAPTLPAEMDPKKAGKRIEPAPSPHRSYLMMIAEKTEERVPFQSWPQQSDYTSAWEKTKHPGDIGRQS
jgi:hypothetical protein